ncbi:MAG: hypothetical protein KIPDCIKN_00564 [Haliscomenobacter sp.]|jgi:hypothetical protein|nr:hypothetical protein [Haliscomenobacter sp.]
MPKRTKINYIRFFNISGQEKRHYILYFCLGLSQKTVFAPVGQKIVSFFKSNKKLQRKFLLDLKKETKISCRWQRLAF